MSEKNNYNIQNTVHPYEQRHRDEALEGATKRDMLQKMDLADVIDTKGVPPEFGTDLDPNVAGNIYEQMEKAAQPERPQDSAAYTEAEGFADQLLDAGSFQEAVGIVALTEAEGVTKNADGSYTIGADGQTGRFTQEGVPMSDPTEQPPSPES